ncbi:MAG: hypothetical protein ACI4QA_02995 [Candidatus Spyradosoma sp.]
MFLSAKNILRAAGALALGAAFANLSACRQPPSPPYRAEGSAFGVEYATFYWKTEKDFKRISEFFTDEENTGSDVVVRSDPETRTGLYLIVNLECGSLVPAGSVAELRYFHPVRTGEQIQRWTLPEFLAAPHRELRLGLTGTAWDKSLSRKKPSAWKLTVVSPSGETLVLRRSFLWSEKGDASAR